MDTKPDYFNMLTEEEVTVITNSEDELMMIAPDEPNPKKITKDYFNKNLVPLHQIKDLGDFLFDDED